MKVLYKTSTTQKDQIYPSIDDKSPIIDLNIKKINGEKIMLSEDHPDYVKYYYIEETKLDNPDPNKYTLNKNDELTNEIHPEYNHLLICRRSYELIEKPEFEIINKLNVELGEYLDGEYPLWERTKHAGEGNYILLAMIENRVTQEQLDKKAYIDSIYNWITECRAERQRREDAYLNIENSIFPNFYDYPARP